MESDLRGSSKLYEHIIYECGGGIGSVFGLVLIALVTIPASHTGLHGFKVRSTPEENFLLISNLGGTGDSSFIGRTRMDSCLLAFF